MKAFANGAVRRLLRVAALILLAACAPRLQPLGPEIGEPLLDGDRLVMADGVGLPLRVWYPTDRPRVAQPEAVFLALHGFNDYSFGFDIPARQWAAHGILTYAYDQRGFGDTPHRGLWPGDERLIGDLVAASELIAARHPGVPLYLLGESMGGAVVLAAVASERPPRGDGLILVAPAVWGREAQGPLQSAALWLAAHSMPWLTVTGRGLNIMPTDNIAVLRQMARDPLVIKETRIDALYGLVGLMDKAWEAAPALDGRSVLLLYGAREEVIPEDTALAWLRRIPVGQRERPRIAVYPAGYHMLLRDLDAELVIADVMEWIADRRAALPSGADLLAEAVVYGDHDDFAPVRDGVANTSPAEPQPPAVAGRAAAAAAGGVPPIPALADN